MQKAVASLENLVEQMSATAQDLEAEAVESQSFEAEKYIASVVGFSTKLSSVVAAEVDNFARFPSANEFKAYVGIDPKVSQSGASCRTGRITKRGNPFLRSAFYLAAQVARQHDPELKQFFEKKMGEGKKFKVAVCAVARKLCERVYAVVTKKTFYEVRQPSLT